MRKKEKTPRFFTIKIAIAGGGACILAHTCCKNKHFESLIFDAPCGWESRNQTFGALTFQEEAKKHDRGASADARVELRVRKKERTPRFFTIKMAIAGGSSEARILS